jgi:hypothetical protein
LTFTSAPLTWRKACEMKRGDASRLRQISAYLAKLSLLLQRLSWRPSNLTDESPANRSVFYEHVSFPRFGRNSANNPDCLVVDVDGVNDRAAVGPALIGIAVAELLGHEACKGVDLGRIDCRYSAALRTGPIERSTRCAVCEDFCSSLQIKSLRGAVNGQLRELNFGLWQEFTDLSQELARGLVGFLATIAIVISADVVANRHHDGDFRAGEFRRRRRQGLRAFHHR